MKREWCRAALLGCVMGLGSVGVLYAGSWAESHILLGQAALQEQNYTGAVAYFTHALQVDTRNVLAQQGLRQALAQEAQVDPIRDQSEVTTLAYFHSLPQIATAQFSAQELANVAPETPEKLEKKSLLVLAQLQHGDYTAAMRTAVPLPKRYGHPTAWNLLGLAQYQTGDTVKAKAAFNKALALNPLFYAARLNLAMVFMNGGDFQNAETQIKRVLVETNGRYRQAFSSMATLKKLEGDKAAAEMWSLRAGESL